MIERFIYGHNKKEKIHKNGYSSFSIFNTATCHIDIIYTFAGVLEYVSSG